MQKKDWMNLLALLSLPLLCFVGFMVGAGLFVYSAYFQNQGPIAQAFGNAPLELVACGCIGAAVFTSAPILLLNLWLKSKKRSAE
jgi:hypothetical protein